MAAVSRRELLWWWAQLAIFACAVCALVLGLGQRGDEAASAAQDPVCGTRVDVVLTWVNGSDPVHLARRRWRLQQQPQQDDAPQEEESHEGRFRDYDTLRYALRSVWRHWPALGALHLVLADDEALPVWLNVSGAVASGVPLHVVRHSQIMPQDALPTFNSNAIETNLHLIPGLSPCFVYLNDDMMFGRQVPLDVYWNSATQTQRVHWGSWKAPVTEFMDTNSWHKAIALNNDLLNHVYSTPARRREYPLHGCYFFHRATFARMRELFADSYQRTLATPFRSSSDNVVSFLYPHVAVAEFGAAPAQMQLHYAVLTPSPRSNIDSLRTMVRKQPQCICVNDGLDDPQAEPGAVDVKRAVTELQMALELLFPTPAPWESLQRRPRLGPIPRRYFEGSHLKETLFLIVVLVPVGVSAGVLLLCAFVSCCVRKKG